MLLVKYDKEMKISRNELRNEQENNFVFQITQHCIYSCLNENKMMNRTLKLQKLCKQKVKTGYIIQNKRTLQHYLYHQNQP